MGRTLLFKRQKLIDSGIQRQQLKVRNLKLYEDGKKIQVGRNYSLHTKLDVILFNCQSIYLADRRHIVATCIYQYMPDICLLTETWLRKETMDGEHHLAHTPL